MSAFEQLNQAGYGVCPTTSVFLSTKSFQVTNSTRWMSAGRPLQTFAWVKCLDEDGEVAWAFRTSEPFNLEELLGAFVVQVETLKRKLVRHREDEDPTL